MNSPTSPALTSAGPICVGLDGSPGARDALALARGFGDHLGVPVMAVFVASDTQSTPPDTPGADVVPTVVRGPSGAEGLKAFAHSEGAQLLVIGSSSRTGFGRISPGETATQLFSSAPVSVAIAPSGYLERSAALATVGCGYDDGPGARSALHWALALCAAGAGAGAETRLEVLTVVPRLAFGGTTVGALPSSTAQSALEREARRDIDALVDGHQGRCDIRGVRLAGDAATALVSESARLDLLVLGSRGRGPWRSVVLGSVSAEVVRGAFCPVVVVPVTEPEAPDG